MNDSYLPSLSEAAKAILRDEKVIADLDRARGELFETEAPFVWCVIDIDRYRLPENIKSGWIFVLKRNHASGSHYHPNSTQHMLVVEGRGSATIADRTRAAAAIPSPENIRSSDWFVIPENAPHEFFIGDEDMVVISFHTCPAEELLEVDSHDESQRLYEE